MTQTTSTNGMAYEATGTKQASTGTAKKQCLKVANQLNTSSLLWLLVKRHKVGLLIISNAFLTLNWIFPEWLQLLKSL